MEVNYYTGKLIAKLKSASIGEEYTREQIIDALDYWEDKIIKPFRVFNSYELRSILELKEGNNISFREIYKIFDEPHNSYNSYFGFKDINFYNTLYDYLSGNFKSVLSSADKHKEGNTYLPSPFNTPLYVLTWYLVKKGIRVIEDLSDYYPVFLFKKDTRYFREFNFLDKYFLHERKIDTQSVVKSGGEFLKKSITRTDKNAN